MSIATKEDFDDLLDECYPEIEIGYLKLRPSEVLFKCDPIAYNESFLDFQDGLMKMEDE